MSGMIRRVADVGDVSISAGGVRIVNVGPDLTVTPDEARSFAHVLLETADVAEELGQA